MPLTNESALRKDRTTGKATMEPRHFATVAAVIASIGDREDRARVAELFANELRYTNPNFNRARFLRACMEA